MVYFQEKLPLYEGGDTINGYKLFLYQQPVTLPAHTSFTNRVQEIYRLFSNTKTTEHSTGQEQIPKAILPALANYLLGATDLRVDHKEKEFLALERKKKSGCPLTAEENDRLLDLKQDVLYYVIHPAKYKYKDYAIIVNHEMERLLSESSKCSASLQRTEKCSDSYRQQEYRERISSIKEIKYNIKICKQGIEHYTAQIAIIKKNIQTLYQRLKKTRNKQLISAITEQCHALKLHKEERRYLHSRMKELADDYKLCTSHFITFKGGDY